MTTKKTTDPKAPAQAKAKAGWTLKPLAPRPAQVVRHNKKMKPNVSKSQRRTQSMSSAKPTHRKVNQARPRNKAAKLTPKETTQPMKLNAAQDRLKERKKRLQQAKMTTQPEWQTPSPEPQRKKGQTTDSGLMEILNSMNKSRK